MLDRDLVSNVLQTAKSGGADWSELFMEDTVTMSLRTLNGAVKDATGGNEYGAGIRILYGSKVVYAYTNDCSEDGLLEIANAISKAHGSSGITDSAGRGGLDFRVSSPKKLYEIKHHPLQTSQRANSPSRSVGAFHQLELGALRGLKWMVFDFV